MEPPTFKEWIESNPGQSMNDYYKKFPVKWENSSLDNHMQLSISQKIPSNRSLIISTAICTIGFIGYFSPWFSIPVLHLSVSGHDLIQIANILIGGNKDLKNVQDYVKLLYLIPATYAIVVFGVLLRSYFITGLGTVINILTVGVVLRFLFMLPSETFNTMSFGLYLVVFSTIGLLCNIFMLQFYKQI